MERAAAGEPWTMSDLSIEGILAVPEVGIQIPVAEIYEDIDVSGQEDAPA